MTTLALPPGVVVREYPENGLLTQEPQHLYFREEMGLPIFIPHDAPIRIASQRLTMKETTLDLTKRYLLEYLQGPMRLIKDAMSAPDTRYYLFILGVHFSHELQTSDGRSYFEGVLEYDLLGLTPFGGNKSALPSPLQYVAHLEFLQTLSTAPNEAILAHLEACRLDLSERDERGARLQREVFARMAESRRTRLVNRR